MDYFCVDIETSGPTPGRHNLLSIGLTHVRRLRGSYQLMESLYVELRPVFPEFDEAAMRVNGLDVNRLKAEGEAPESAMRAILAWVERQQKHDELRPVFVAHNAPFDWMFFQYHVGQAELDNPFGWSAIDTKALAMGQLGLPWEDTNLRLIAEIVGASHKDPSKLHHAGEDARHTARVFCALLNSR